MGRLHQKPASCKADGQVPATMTWGRLPPYLSVLRAEAYHMPQPNMPLTSTGCCSASSCTLVPLPCCFLPTCDPHEDDPIILQLCNTHSAHLVIRHRAVRQTLRTTNRSGECQWLLHCPTLHAGNLSWCMGWARTALLNQAGSTPHAKAAQARKAEPAPLVLTCLMCQGGSVMMTPNLPRMLQSKLRTSQLIHWGSCSACR